MRRSLVRIAITLIAANAALAIVILLGGDMGETGGRILGTSLLATATARTGLRVRPEEERVVAEPVEEVAAVAGDDEEAPIIAESGEEHQHRLGGLGVEPAPGLVEE